jgi:hypothetical protein
MPFQIGATIPLALAVRRRYPEKTHIVVMHPAANQRLADKGFATALRSARVLYAGARWSRQIRPPALHRWRNPEFILAGPALG